MQKAGFLLALLTFGVPATAVAQWTLPQGQTVWTTGLDFQYANSEFFGQPDEPSAERAFPLRGQYFGAAVTFDARFGLTDELELEIAVPLRVVAYTSDPVILLPQPADSAEASLDYYQRNTIQLAQATAGLADLQVAGRYRFLAEPFLLTGELRLKVPGGYSGPAGTFGAAPRSAQDFVDNIGTFVAPENITDDVTLGDAQVDLTGRVLAGVSFSTGTFVAGDVGYNARFDDAGHQFVASLRVGQLIENLFLLFVGGSFAYTVTEGRVIGVSVAADDPNLPAEEYGGLTNLRLREVRLERNFLDLYGGVIVRLSPEVEMKFAYGRVVWGRNVSAVNTFSVAIGARTNLFGTPPPAPAAQSEAYDDDEDYDDEEYEDEDDYEDEGYEDADDGTDDVEPSSSSGPPGVTEPASSDLEPDPNEPVAP